MTQLDQPAAWRKEYRRRLGMLGLSQLEHHLAMVINAAGVRDVARPVRGQPRLDVGWATREDGRPMVRRELAAAMCIPPTAAGLAELDAAILGLVDLGHAVVADDGAVGLTGWTEMQESPEDRRARDDERRAREAERKRVARAAKSGERPPPSADEHGTSTGHDGYVSADSPAPSADSRADVSRERTEDRGQISSNSDGAPASPPAPASTIGRRIALARESMGYGQALISRRTGIAPATLRAIEADEADPTADELALLAKHIGDPTLAAAPALRVDTGVAETAGELHDARASLGAAEPRPSVTGDVAREFWAPAKAGLVPEGMTLVEAWRVVIRRATEEARRNAEDGRGGRDLEFMTLRSLGGATRWRRYLQNSDLDRRREAGSQGQRARASPPGAHVVVTKGRKYVDGNPLAGK